MNNTQVLDRFYTAFQQLDAETMCDCYAPDVSFSDPVFPTLKGDETKAMWRMLCSQATEFSLTFDNIDADENHGKASWEATYKFSKTGRIVHNKIQASFVFKDGKIVQHTDDFDLWKWSHMALGPMGLLLGWTPFMKNKIRQMAASGLKQFMSQKPK